MYKLIKHEITEEHFNHPMILPNNVKPALAVLGDMPSYPVFHQLPDPVINENTLMFRMDARTALTKFALGMINFAVATEGNLNSASDVETRLYKAGAELGSFLVPYYGMTAGDTAGKLFSALARIGTDCVVAVRDGKSLDTIGVAWASCIEDIATHLNALNPAYWPKELLIDQLTNLCKFWKDNIIARFAKDTAGNTISLDNILKVAVTGVPDHVLASYSSIADTISQGIIAQFSRLFLK